jgi:probable HAF family extracellular repeat protein
MHLSNRRVGGLFVFCIVLLIHTSSIPAEYAIKDIGTLGGTKSCAYAVNNLGQVVGSAGTQDTDGQMRAFLYDTVGGIRKLDPNFNTTYSIALDINDAGQAAGYFGASNPHAFLYKPGLDRGRPLQRLRDRPTGLPP